MIRFILIKESGNENLGFRGSAYYTLDCNVPELEEALKRGGKSEYEFEHHYLLSCELLTENSDDAT